MTSIETPVLVLGGGPAGLTTATALAQYGVEHVLVNKHEGTTHTPRAHIANQRTVEIMRHLGRSLGSHKDAGGELLRVMRTILCR